MTVVFRTHRDGLTWVCGRFRLEQLAWVLWGLAITAISFKVAHNPHCSVTEIYRRATLDWWQGQDIYGPGIHGFLYLPSSAVLFTPWALLPLPAADMAWRITILATLLAALGRLARLIEPAQAPRVLAVALLVSLPAATVNIQRAQTELLMFALLVLAAVSAARGRWNAGALWLGLAVAIKPLALVPLLLFGAVFPSLRPRLALAGAAVLALPFLHPDPGYVLHQYGDMIDKLFVASNPGNGRWNEVSMMLAAFGIDMPAPAMATLRAAAALATLALSFVAVARHGRGVGALAVLALGTGYLLAFNPRTELGSYMNMAALLGLFAGTLLARNHHRGVAAAAIVVCLAFGTHFYGDWIYRPTDVWLKPALDLIVLACLAVWLVLPGKGPNWNRRSRFGVAAPVLAGSGGSKSD